MRYALSHRHPSVLYIGQIKGRLHACAGLVNAARVAQWTFGQDIMPLTEQRGTATAAANGKRSSLRQHGAHMIAQLSQQLLLGNVPMGS